MERICLRNGHDEDFAMDHAETEFVDTGQQTGKHEAPESRVPLDLGPDHRNKHEAPDLDD
jgi:hypothetical protein